MSVSATIHLKRVLFTLIIITISPHLKAEKSTYESAYETLKAMLEDKAAVDFKKAIFTVENAYYGNTMSYEAFNKGIKDLAQVWRA